MQSRRVVVEAGGGYEEGGEPSGMKSGPAFGSTHMSGFSANNPGGSSLKGKLLSLEVGRQLALGAHSEHDGRDQPAQEGGGEPALREADAGERARHEGAGRAQEHHLRDRACRGLNEAQLQRTEGRELKTPATDHRPQGREDPAPAAAARSPAPHRRARAPSRR